MVCTVQRTKTTHGLLTFLPYSLSYNSTSLTGYDHFNQVGIFGVCLFDFFKTFISFLHCLEVKELLREGKMAFVSPLRHGCLFSQALLEVVS